MKGVLIIMFKIYTLGKVRNNQMAPENFSKVFSAPKEVFIISQKASKNIFSKGVLMFIFKLYTPKNVQNRQTTSKNFFKGLF